jgi:hypothetical protein
MFRTAFGHDPEPAGTQFSIPFRRIRSNIVTKKTFYGDEFLTLHSVPKLDDNFLLDVFSILNPEP